VVQTAAMNAVPGFAPSSPAGKWTLELAGGGSCVMNFTAPPDAVEGTIAPSSGCQWSFVTGGLVIRNHKAEKAFARRP